jgi:hypothetical protein
MQQADKKKWHTNSPYIARTAHRSMCPCEEEEQTTDHLIFHCNKLSNQSNGMIKQIKKTPVALGLRHMKH